MSVVWYVVCVERPRPLAVLFRGLSVVRFPGPSALFEGPLTILFFETIWVTTICRTSNGSFSGISVVISSGPSAGLFLAFRGTIFWSGVVERDVVRAGLLWYVCVDWSSVVWSEVL